MQVLPEYKFVQKVYCTYWEVVEDGGGGGSDCHLLVMRQGVRAFQNDQLLKMIKDWIDP